MPTALNRETLVLVLPTVLLLTVLLPRLLNSHRWLNSLVWGMYASFCSRSNPAAAD